jgi:hypothetical protein
MTKILAMGLSEVEGVMTLCPTFIFMDLIPVGVLLETLETNGNSVVTGNESMAKWSCDSTNPKITQAEFDSKTSTLAFLCIHQQD